MIGSLHQELVVWLFVVDDEMRCSLFEASDIHLGLNLHQELVVWLFIVDDEMRCSFFEASELYLECHVRDFGG